MKIKKLFSVFLATMIILSLSAFASNATSTGATIYDPSFSVSEVSSADCVETRASFNLSFSNVAPKAVAVSSESTYLYNGEDAMRINSLTWSSSGQDIRVGFKNVQTGKLYGYTFSGGTITNFTLEMGDAPTGEYKIYVQNVGSGTQKISGNMSYEFIEL